jgi:hypothetical protein
LSAVPEVCDAGAIICARGIGSPVMEFTTTPSAAQPEDGGVAGGWGVSWKAIA